MLPGSISRSTSRSAGRAAPSKVRLTSRRETRPAPSGSGGAFGRRGDPRRAVEHLEDAGARGGRSLGGAQHVAERPHRRDQHQQVRVEGGERADGQRPVDHVPAADQQDQRQPEVGQEADQRRVAGLDLGRVHLLVEHALHRMAEPLELALLLRERLDHPHARDVLLGVGGQLGDPLLGLLERGLRVLAVAVGDQHDERHRRQRQRGEPRLEHEHRHPGERDREDRLADEDQAVAEEEAHRLEVDGGARHQLARSAGGRRSRARDAGTARRACCAGRTRRPARPGRRPVAAPTLNPSRRTPAAPIAIAHMISWWRVAVGDRVDRRPGESRDQNGHDHRAARRGRTTTRPPADTGAGSLGVAGR